MFKLITLNIWGGHVNEPLLKFVQQHRDVDIFCFQEVYFNSVKQMSTDDKKINYDIYSDIQNVLGDHHGLFCPVIEDWYGLALFIKNSCSIDKHGDSVIYNNPNYQGRGPTHPRKLQWVSISHNNKSYDIVNVHGLWNGQGKDDSPERLQQSQYIKEFVDQLKNPVVLCGDFNLTPNAQSLKLIADGMIDLIKDKEITSTRTSLYDKDERYADYVFVSPEIQVQQFEVLPDCVSDHVPLLLEFS